MKKIVTLIALFSVSATYLLAQTPNPGFESWTHTSAITGSYDTPDNWNTANPKTAITGVLSCFKSTSFHSGSFAIQLITKQIPSPFNQLVPGIATTGTIDQTTQSITGGIAYTLKPDSITGWYKYTPQGGENGFVSFYLFGSAANNTDTIAKATFSTPKATVATYTRFAAALTYTTTTTPVANSMWLLGSSNNDGLTSSIGSTLYVDDLALVFNPNTGVAEQNMPELTVGPNPAIGHFEINNPLNRQAIFVLYDAMGRKVAEEKTEGTTTFVNVNTLPNGLYTYSIIDENNIAVKGGKLIIKK